MRKCKCTAHVLWCWNNPSLVWVIAELLEDAFLAHGWIINSRIDHCVPDEGRYPLRKHIRHKLELFAELETAIETLLHKLRLALLDHTFRIMYLHVVVA